MCTGSGFIARRTAIDNIGGWPLVEAGEDYMCSALLSSAGWNIVFVRDKLQYGLAPESLYAHVKQQIRWVLLCLDSNTLVFMTDARKDRLRYLCPQAICILPTRIWYQHALDSENYRYHTGSEGIFVGATTSGNHPPPPRPIFLSIIRRLADQKLNKRV